MMLGLYWKEEAEERTAEGFARRWQSLGKGTGLSREAGREDLNF